MSPRAWMIIAIVVGTVSLVSGFLLYRRSRVKKARLRAIHERQIAEQSEVVPPRPPHVNVVAALVNIPKKVVLTQDMIQIVKVPPPRPPGSIMEINISKLYGKITKTAMLKDTVLLEKFLYRPSVFSHLIPDYKKAVTIAVSNHTTEQFMIEPRDFVDVVGEYSESQSGVKGGYVKIAVQDAEVLAIDNLMTLKPLAGAPKTQTPQAGKTATAAIWYTLAVTHREAEDLIMAEGFKRPLQLLLRNREDSDFMKTPGADKIALLGKEFVDRYIGFRNLFGADIPVEIIREDRKSIARTPPY